MWKDELQKWNNELPEFPRLPREFFTRDGITLAKELLGKILVHETPIGRIRGIITEVESYMGVDDKGSHTYGGRRTQRTEPMFHIGGTSYVYFTYGMYYCMNITSDAAENPQAVLLRSVIPADRDSKERMLYFRKKVSEESAQKRNAAKGKKLTEADMARIENQILKHLADGPGKLCIAMNINKSENDIDMVESNSFYVTEGIEVAPSKICSGKRIGIDYAQEAADYLWRFFVM